MIARHWISLSLSYKDPGYSSCTPVFQALAVTCHRPLARRLTTAFHCFFSLPFSPNHFPQPMSQSRYSAVPAVESQGDDHIHINFDPWLISLQTLYQRTHRSDVSSLETCAPSPQDFLRSLASQVTVYFFSLTPGCFFSPSGAKGNQDLTLSIQC